MIHQPSHGAQGTVTDTRIAVEEGLKLKRKLTQIMADRTGQPYEKVEQDMERDKWLSPEDALAYGIIDKIL
jgi:ATP-dependent Clp protease, protease subunit